MNKTGYINNLFEAAKYTSGYKDQNMMEIMIRREEFEKSLDAMWNLYRKGNILQLPEYQKGVQKIKDSGLKVLRNSFGQHKIVYKK